MMGKGNYIAFFLLLVCCDQLVSAPKPEKTVSEGAFVKLFDPFSKQLSEEEKIDQLITALRNLQGAVFIRNGKEYKPDEAADHLQKKFKKHKKKVDTASEFIDRLATVSSSDEPYMIRFPDGSMVKCAEFLHKELARIENR
jgi:hypothetical protein